MFLYHAVPTSALRRRATGRVGRAHRWACAALSAVAFMCAAAPLAAAQAPALPVSTVVRVVPAPGSDGPTPTGRLVVSIDGVPVASVPLTQGRAPLLLGEFATAGRTVSVRYSGDGTYDPSGGVTVRVPSGDGVTIGVRPLDRLAPTVTIRTPAAGAVYEVGDRVLADYACQDTGDGASGVTRCDASVPSGEPLDTSAAGERTFDVRAEDAAGNASAEAVPYTVLPPLETATPATGPLPAGAGSPDDGPSAPAGATPPPGPPGPPGTAPAGAGGLAGGLAGGALASGAQQPLAAASPASRSSATPAPSAAPPAAREATAASTAGAQAYDPRSEPGTVVGVMVAAFTLMQLGARRGGLAAAGAAALLVAGRGRRRRRSPRRSSSSDDDGVEYEGVDVEQLEAGPEEVKLGDRSRSWRIPGTPFVDALSAGLPVALAVRSPLLARVTADGSYLRAMLGAASLLPLSAGLVLGIAAVNDTGGAALPPALALTIAIAVLGIIDAAAGFAAVLAFVIGVALHGGLDSATSLRIMLGLGGLWFAVPIIAGAARPLRRPPAAWLEETWDRAADFVIGSLIGAWAVQQMVLALPALARRELPIAEHANAVAVAVLLALVLRLAGETLAAHHYPGRLAAATPAELPEQSRAHRFGAILLRTALFVFVAILVMDAGWQLWVAAGLFAVPQALAVVEDRLPNSPRVFRVVPKGLVELVLMLLVTAGLGALLLHALDADAPTFFATTLVILALPGFVMSMLGLFGRDGVQREVSWPARFGGVGLLGLGVVLVLSGVG